MRRPRTPCPPGHPPPMAGAAEARAGRATPTTQHLPANRTADANRRRAHRQPTTVRQCTDPHGAPGARAVPRQARSARRGIRRCLHGPCRQRSTPAATPTMTRPTRPATATRAPRAMQGAPPGWPAWPQATPCDKAAAGAAQVARRKSTSTSGCGPSASLRSWSPSTSSSRARLDTLCRRSASSAGTVRSARPCTSKVGHPSGDRAGDPQYRDGTARGARRRTRAVDVRGARRRAGHDGPGLRRRHGHCRRRTRDGRRGAPGIRSARACG